MQTCYGAWEIFWNSLLCCKYSSVGMLIFWLYWKTVVWMQKKNLKVLQLLCTVPWTTKVTDLFDPPHVTSIVYYTICMLNVHVFSCFCFLYLQIWRAFIHHCSVCHPCVKTNHLSCVAGLSCDVTLFDYYTNYHCLLLYVLQFICHSFIPIVFVIASVI